jgi:catechol 2,3-dioxygenase-like lactoylglutathione lyase family enzyme
MSTTRAATKISAIGTVVVPVTDQDRALEFYVGKIGLELRSDTPFGNGMRWLEVAPAGSETVLAIVPPRPGGPVGVGTGIVLTSEDIEADHATLKASGVDVDPEVAYMGDPVPPMFWFRDPDGNSLVIVGRTGSA